MPALSASKVRTPAHSNGCNFRPNQTQSSICLCSVQRIKRMSNSADAFTFLVRPTFPDEPKRNLLTHGILRRTPWQNPHEMPRIPSPIISCCSDIEKEKFHKNEAYDFPNPLSLSTADPAEDLARPDRPAAKSSNRCIIKSDPGHFAVSFSFVCSGSSPTLLLSATSES